ncbi:MAG TPA: NAD(P)/FAD-dependent oxidoreductase [Gemmatimonadaceae bacterium]|nr:NAD(P)/FAD-dependent oxidoreductase [Gemmatimonadaceae bacterium]
MQNRLSDITVTSPLPGTARPDGRKSPPGGTRRRPHVVILGGGFGGLAAARALARAPVDVTIIDRTNYHLFQPLLYQVATALLAPSDIVSPIRHLVRTQQNTAVLLDEVLGVDVERRVVAIRGEPYEMPYDYLIVATGARHSYFGHDEWEPLAPGLKGIEDAREIRRRLLLAFEEAEQERTAERDPAALTFVIVGGGPTGVELAGMLPEMARLVLRGEYRHINPGDAHVILLEGGDRILPAFSAPLGRVARRDLEGLGVDVRTNARVTRIEPGAVYVGEQRIPARTVFWAAGNEASPITRTLGVPLDSAGRVPAQPDLSIPGHPDVFVVGDIAAVTQADGSFVPGVAPAAMQEGAYAARSIIRTMRGEPRAPFHYRNKGELATIGRHRAVVEIGRFRLTGWLAWWFWLIVHILYLIGFRNRLSVLVEWAYAYLLHERGARIISYDQRPAVALEAEVAEVARR